MILFGFDPGGLNNFGWACLSIGKSGIPISLNTGCSSNAPSAITEASHYAAGKAPAAVGIDAPLYWIAEGDRLADAGIRTRVCAAGGTSGNVGHVNSLRGACLVQGVLAARQIAETWPSAKITETHPKALHLLHFEARQFLADNLPVPHTEHEGDAALAAYAAWAFAVGFTGWDDLVIKERAPYFPSGHTVSYWFPC